MSNYVQSTNFATKDALSSGDPLKIVKGTEINTEFNNIATAIATKADTSSLPTIATTGEAQAGTENTKFITSLRLREGFSASGDAPVYASRAWVRFVGNSAAILASGNVSSITKIATGEYEVNFTTAMDDANYGFSVSSGAGQTGVRVTTTSLLKVQTENSSGTTVDSGFVSAIIFR